MPEQNQKSSGFAEKLRAKMTEPEKKLWDFLKTKPLGFKFRRQHPFSTYVLDFYCHRAQLAIEIDGKYVPQHILVMNLSIFV